MENAGPDSRSGHPSILLLAKGSDHPAFLASDEVGGKSVFHRFNTG
jgi:hypothetical protein